MSKCLQISKEIWRSLSLVWWNLSQVWSQKLWFFDSAIFECLHNTWHSRDLVTTSSVIIHSEDEKIVQKIFFVDSEQHWHCLIFVKNVVKSTSHHSQWCEIPFWWNCWVSFVKTCITYLLNLKYEDEKRVNHYMKKWYWLSMKLIKLNQIKRLQL